MIISELLNRKKIPHNVLNAKNHEKEAHIIERAGEKGAVTVATNMAGRGTDIILGLGVESGGGLYVLGSERHESRRIDDQLVQFRDARLIPIGLVTDHLDILARHHARDLERPGADRLARKLGHPELGQSLGGRHAEGSHTARQYGV